MADVAAGPNRKEPEQGPLELESRRWLEAVEREAGPLSLFDAHTHFGHNDPDGCLAGAAGAAGDDGASRSARRRLPDAGARRIPTGQRRGAGPGRGLGRPPGALLPGRSPQRCAGRGQALPRRRRSRHQAASPRRAVRHGRARGRGAGVTGRRAAGPGPDSCGPRHPRLGARHGPPGRALPGRAPDPRPCGGQRHCLAVAADAGASEPAHRHFLVEPGRSDRALLPGAPGPDSLGQRFAVRGASRRRRAAPSLRPGSRPRQRGDRLDRRRPDRAHPGRQGTGRRRSAAWPSRPARPIDGADLLAPADRGGSGFRRGRSRPSRWPWPASPATSRGSMALPARR